MGIEEELSAFLENSMRDLANKDRDIEMISHFYGFRDAVWPTLDDTGQAFGGLTRENVRQILNRKFRGIASSASFPQAARCAEILSRKPFVTGSNFVDALVKHDLVSREVNIQGVLNLLHDLSLCHDYVAYTPGLKELTKSNVEQCEDIFLVVKDERKLVDSLRADLKKVSTLPGQLGIANLDYLRDGIADFDEKRDFLKRIVECTPKVWFKGTGEEFWYVFEARDNVLTNYSEKVFSLIASCDLGVLSSAYRNALDYRNQPHPYPDAELIEEYLRSSMHFEISGSIARFSGERGTLSEMESALCAFLSAHPKATFQEIREALAAQSFGGDSIKKTAPHSPFIVVDKSLGRVNYRYSLIPQGSDAEMPDLRESRYSAFRRKLSRLRADGTDESIASRRRREQNILQQWLFGESDGIYQCAICQKEYGSRTALNAAHKKKRSICSEAERLDPHIVMPVCNFGCDYLYEVGHVYVKDGLVRMNAATVGSAAERETAEALDGKPLPLRWLEGNPSYFHRPDGA